jgi:hypothetical protein
MRRDEAELFFAVGLASYVLSASDRRTTSGDEAAPVVSSGNG